MYSCVLELIVHLRVVASHPCENHVEGDEGAAKHCHCHGWVGFHGCTSINSSIHEGEEGSCEAKSAYGTSEPSLSMVDSKLICISKQFCVSLNLLHLVLWKL